MMKFLEKWIRYFSDRGVKYENLCDTSLVQNRNIGYVDYDDFIIEILHVLTHKYKYSKYSDLEDAVRNIFCLMITYVEDIDLHEDIIPEDHEGEITKNHLMEWAEMFFDFLYRAENRPDNILVRSTKFEATTRKMFLAEKLINSDKVIMKHVEQTAASLKVIEKCRLSLWG